MPASLNITALVAVISSRSNSSGLIDRISSWSSGQVRVLSCTVQILVATETAHSNCTLVVSCSFILLHSHRSLSTQRLSARFCDERGDTPAVSSAFGMLHLHIKLMQQCIKHVVCGAKVSAATPAHHHRLQVPHKDPVVPTALAESFLTIMNFWY